MGAASIGIIVVQCIALCADEPGQPLALRHDQQFRPRPRRRAKRKARSARARAPPAWRRGARGATVSRSDGKANANESMNFSQKRTVLTAAAISGLGPSRSAKSARLPAKPMASAAANSPAEPDRLGNRVGGERGDELGRPHPIDLRQAAPSDFSARWSATLTATSDIDRRFAVAAIDWPSREIEVTMSRWRGASVSRSFARVAQRVRVFGLRRGQELLVVLERLDPPPAAPAQSVDNLVSRYGVDPGPSGCPGSQVWRLRWIANRVSCTASSMSASPAPARAKAARAIARTERLMSSKRRRYAPSSPAIEALIIRDQGSSGGPSTDWAFIRPSFRFVCRYRSGEIFCSRRANERPM